MDRIEKWTRSGALRCSTGRAGLPDFKRLWCGVSPHHFMESTLVIAAGYRAARGDYLVITTMCAIGCSPAAEACLFLKAASKRKTLPVPVPMIMSSSLCTAMVVILSILSTSQQAEASHLRYGNLTWRIPDPINSPRTVEFKLTVAW